MLHMSVTGVTKLHIYAGFSLSLKKARFYPLMLQMSPKFAFKRDIMSPKI